MVKILLVTPKLSIPGGVTEFNKMLLHYSCSNIKPFQLTSSGSNQIKFVKQISLFYDIIRFILILSFSSIKVVHLGPSLGRNAIKRDGIFCALAKLYNKKVFIHWHGWNPENEYLLEGLSLKFVKRTIFKADHIKFLSSTFSNLFLEKGYLNKISHGNTFIDDSLLQGYSNTRKSNNTINILFLSTVSINKGIYIAINCFKELVSDFNISLTIAGIGPELENIKKMVTSDITEKISFTGYITGQAKKTVYTNADIYLFPSQYEGMPTSIIEAMGFGLPVVCSKVGALPDFFINEKMGYIIDKTDYSSFKEALIKLIKNKEKRESIGIFNHQYATKHFLASKAVAIIEKDYIKLIS